MKLRASSATLNDPTSRAQRLAGSAVNREPRFVGALGWQVRSEVVERERILRGWTRAQLTQAADIDPKTLRDLLTGRRRPTLGTVSTLSRALGMPLRDVIAVVEQPHLRGEPRRERSAPRPAQAVLPLQ
jgi:ribosome-binding protein aMBF1 (putative translation factor)